MDNIKGTAAGWLFKYILYDQGARTPLAESFGVS